MTTTVPLAPSAAKRVAEMEEKWMLLRERIAKAQPFPEVAEILGSKAHSVEEIEELLRRFEKGEFRNQE